MVESARNYIRGKESSSGSAQSKRRIPSIPDRGSDWMGVQVC